MKTISSRFLKGGLAILLAVIMLFSSSITGFAAILDNVQTRANIDVSDTGAQYNIYWQGHIYFLAPETWNIDTYKYIQVDITRTTSASSSNYQFYAGTMTRIGTSRLFYLKINADHRSWGQNEYISFTANSSTYGSGTFTLNKNHNYMVPLDYGVTNANGYYLFKPSSETNNSTTTNGNSMNGSYNSNRSTLIRAKQTVNIYTDGTQSGAGGTVKMSGYYDSGTSSIASSSDTSTTSANTISYDATQGSKMTLSVASTTTGYKFVGWYDSSDKLLSSSTSYSYNVFNTKTVRAKFEKLTYTVTFKDHDGTILDTKTVAHGDTPTAPANPTRTGYTFTGWSPTVGAVTGATTYTAQYSKNSYTVSASASPNAGGTVSVNPSSVEHGSTANITATPATGYEFKGWSIASGDGTFGNANNASTTFAPTSNSTLTATFAKKTYTVEFVDYNGNQIGDAQTVEHGVTPTAPANPTRTGYTFTGWSPTVGAVTADTTYTAQYTINKHTITVTEADGITGTVKLNNTTTTSGTYDYGTSVSVVITPPTNYKIKNITGDITSGECASYSGNITVNKDYSFTVTYAMSGSCTPQIDNSNMNLKIGETQTRTATPNSFCTNGSGFTYSSNNPSVATVNQSSGLVTALTPGEATITATCKTHSNTNSYKVVVATPTITISDISMNLGQIPTISPTVTNANDYSVTYSESSSAISIDTNGKITATAPVANATVTATLTVGTWSTTKTFKVTVNTPTITIANKTGLAVNGTYTVSSSVSDVNTEYTVTYSANNTKLSISGNQITGLYPGTHTVTATLKVGSWTTTETFTVEVTTPSVSITIPESEKKLLVGQTMVAPITTTADGNPEVKLSAGNSIVISIASDGRATALAEGASSVSATFKYNEYYTASTTVASVTVTDPSITADSTEVALEYGEGKTDDSKTVTLTTNVDKGNGTDDDIDIVVENPNVASASLDGTTLTITANGVGETTVTATFHRKSVVIEVNVTKYDPYVYLYVTDSLGWDNMFIHSWVNGATDADDESVTTLGTSNAQMIYIGKNGDNHKIFAYKFLKGTEPDEAIFVKQNDWPNNDNYIRTDNTVLDFDYGFQALYISSQTHSDNKRKTGDWTDACLIVRPTVSVADVAVSVANTATATATAENAGVLYWTTEDKNIATVADVITTTSTVTGVKDGITTITARAFIDTANSSIKHLPTNYKTDTACWDYISAYDEATVTVAETKYNVSATAKYSADGSSYQEDVIGGNATASAASVSHGNSVTLTAQANEGYRFVGWFLNGELVDGSATYEPTITTDSDYVAKFIKQYNITNNVSNATVTPAASTVDAGEQVTITCTPDAGYRVDAVYVNGTEYTGETITVLDDINITADVVRVYAINWTAYQNRTVNSTYKNWITAEPATAAKGETITLTVINRHDTTSFYGLFSSDDFSADLAYPTPTPVVDDDDHNVYTYEITMGDSDIDLCALFYEYYSNFTYNPATDIYTRTFASVDPAGYTFTIRDHDGEDINVTIGESVGLTIVQNTTGSYTLDVDESYYKTENVVLTIAYDETARYYVLTGSAVAKDMFTVTYNGEVVGSYPAGMEVELPISTADNEYVNDASFEPALGSVASVDKTTNTVTFTMPAYNVVMDVEFGEKKQISFEDATGINCDISDYYIPGDSVTLTVYPQAKYTINSITLADGINAVGFATSVEDGVYTVTFTMPGTDVVLVTDVSAMFTMNSVVVTAKPNQTVSDTGGRVKMNNGTLADGDEVANGTDVTYTAEAIEGYTFIGFFENADCTKMLTKAAMYTVQPTADTTVYALFAQNHYIIGADVTGGWVWESEENDYELMTYDYKTKSYTHQFDGTTAQFKVTTDKANINEIFYDNSITITPASNKCDGLTVIRESGTGDNAIIQNLQTGYEAPTTIYFEPTGAKSYDFYAKATYIGAKVYLSSGRNEFAGLTPTSEFSGFEGVYTVGKETNVYQNHKNKNLAAGTSAVVSEKYRVATLDKRQTITVQTYLSGETASNYLVESYIVYYYKTNKYTIITSNQVTNMGNNTYSASVNVQGDCYIVPIFFYTEDYISSANLEVEYIYFNGAELPSSWGPFVSVYTYGSQGSDTIHPNSGWPGQMMIPTDDGKSFYTRIAIPAPDENGEQVYTPQGVLFSNYMQNSVPSIVKNTTDNDYSESVKDTFGLSDLGPVQTYDYREPITLHEEDYKVITYVAKSSDGYHGDYFRKDTVATQGVTAVEGMGITISDYDFDYLYCRDGVTPMNFNTTPVTGNAYDAVDYYIVAKGDVNYNPNDYGPDMNYDAKWAVDWYVYNSEGVYLTKLLSDALYNTVEVGGETRSALVDLLLKSKIPGATDKSYFDDKTVMISYEGINWCEDKVDIDRNNHQLSIDGQWYGNRADETMLTQVKVGLLENDVYTIDDNNVADYGEAYLMGSDGVFDEETYAVTYAVGAVNMTASTRSGDGNRYRFLGWYIKNEYNEYEKISDSYTNTAGVTEDTIFYALFAPLASDALIVRHQPYVNYTDSEILSHNGTAQMEVEIWSTNLDGTENECVAKGDASTALSIATYNVVDGEKYIIKIRSTPLNQGTFYAWYTDSTTADGTKTYEEILTVGSDVDKTTMVETQFVYIAGDDAKKEINIYTDVTKVSNKASLVYKYINRFGEWRTITVADVPLTDDEVIGFEGNDFQQYVPAFNDGFIMYNNKGESVVFYDESLEDYYTEQGYSGKETYNKIQAYAPSDAVTQVFNGTVSWTIESTYLTYDKSIVTLIADQGVPQYDFTYQVGSTIETAKYYYNDLVQVDAEETYNGKDFLYWQEMFEGDEEGVYDVPGDIICYTTYYNYRIYNDKYIVAVYGDKSDLPEWTPTIDSVTYTREHQDTSDCVYTDFLLAYTSTNGTVLDDVKTPKGIKYGLVMVRDAGYNLFNENDPDNIKVYPDPSNIEDGIETIVTETGKSASFTSDRKYNCYMYDLTKADTTVFNRMNYHLKYNIVGTQYAGYTFTCYAYMVVDGEFILSDPVNVSIWDAATAPVK